MYISVKIRIIQIYMIQPGSSGKAFKAFRPAAKPDDRNGMGFRQSGEGREVWYEITGMGWVSGKALRPAAMAAGFRSGRRMEYAG